MNHGMWKTVLLCVCVLGQFTSRDLETWLERSGFDVPSQSRMRLSESFRSLLHSAVDSLDQILNQSESLKSWTQRHSFGSLEANNDAFVPPGSEKYPYFGFTPVYIGRVIPDGSSLEWTSPCFQVNTARAIKVSSDEIRVEIEVSEPSSRWCSDYYVFGTWEGFESQNFFFHGKHRVDWKIESNASEEILWDSFNRGIRIMRFMHGPRQTLLDISETARMFFQPETDVRVTEESTLRNEYFLKEYTRLPVDTSIRKAVEVDLAEDSIQNGDIFAIVRYDGIDQFLGWSMGSTAGHMAVALWRNNQLFILESMSKMVFWPRSGVQATKFSLWIQRARNASYNIVYIPFGNSDRLDWNASWKWFDQVDGTDYGFHSILLSWFDTRESNFPCLPPDFIHCVNWEIAELMIAWGYRFLPKWTSILFEQALNHRAATKDLSSLEVLRSLYQNDLDPALVATQPERDGTLYRTTRNGDASLGESLVCSSFVCRVWKEAGLFVAVGNEVSCTEFTNWDVLSLRVFDESRMRSNRPIQCRIADPNNPLCQLSGTRHVFINDLNSRDMSSHMAETCPSQAPFYAKPKQC